MRRLLILAFTMSVAFLCVAGLAPVLGRDEATPPEEMFDLQEVLGEQDEAADREYDVDENAEDPDVDEATMRDMFGGEEDAVVESGAEGDEDTGQEEEGNTDDTSEDSDADSESGYTPNTNKYLGEAMFWLISIIVGFGGSAFWLLMIVDALRREPKDFPGSGVRVRETWIFAVILLWVVGALVYYYAVMKRDHAVPAVPSPKASPEKA